MDFYIHGTESTINIPQVNRGLIFVCSRLIFRLVERMSKDITQNLRQSVSALLSRFCIESHVEKMLNSFLLNNYSKLWPVRFSLHYWVNSQVQVKLATLDWAWNSMVTAKGSFRYQYFSCVWIQDQWLSNPSLWWDEQTYLCWCMITCIWRFVLISQGLIKWLVCWM